ncbi:MAG: bifunctional phosphoribosylaminoimidazolecarboxamide formyltransferase/IMP cyclohydrolase [Synechococcaceae cyanobacterium SM2_3_1]|nr:bifunctional phosphoribosylaminoimidazolecarboxamide formyltransferase/IMP cyclohydrolase [Synechococcaceae cyanobacterium SM2_3_1]
MKRLALLSVSNKTGIVDLAEALVNRYHFQVLSSGGTARTLADAGLSVIPVSDYTGAAEILGGRVKTLHPKIHGGILARPDRSQDQADLQAHQISPIELVVVNLYPFEETVAQPDTSLEAAIEQIDIGGPTLVRAAAKNYAHVTVLTDPAQYSVYLQDLGESGASSLELRWTCALQAFDRILAYDQAISRYLHQQAAFDPSATSLPQLFFLQGQQHQVLRYGENPHQSATWYQDPLQTGGWTSAQQLQGKELSYNNLVDLEAARAIAADLMEEQKAAAVIIKHTNPCGVALGSTIAEAYSRALAADPVSAFGGIVALTQPLDLEVATQLTETFLECVVVPACTDAAAQELGRKKNLRVLVLPDLATGPQLMIRQIAGGSLVQTPDQKTADPTTWKIVTQRPPSEVEQQDLSFAWRVAKHVKSNAIVIALQGQTLGIGAGQMNRVGAVQIALEQAGEKARGAVAASDGFFPFGDSVELLANAGIQAIIQPGGSLRDQESIAAANAAGMSMILTGTRHFLH